MSESTMMPPRNLLGWRIAQGVLLAVGVAIVAALLVWPRVGLIVLWDVLIPAAPALLVFAPGLWRNICPLGTVSQLPRRLGWGAQRLTASGQGGFALAALVLLVVLVPARHLGLDDFGLVSAATLAAAGIAAVIGGTWFAGKSGWCSGLCPVHPVEQLYGQRPIVTFTNAHCDLCVRCVDRCPDSTPGLTPLTPVATALHENLGWATVGGFPGFVWGWYQVPTGLPHAGRWWEAFAWTWGALAVSLLSFWIVCRLAGRDRAGFWVRLFAAAAVSIYYWYKLPALLNLAGSGTVLLDLSTLGAPWLVWVLRGLILALFGGWFLRPLPRSAARPWLQRPSYDRSAVAGSSGSGRT